MVNGFGNGGLIPAPRFSLPSPEPMETVCPKLEIPKPEADPNEQTISTFVDIGGRCSRATFTMTQLDNIIAGAPSVISREDAMILLQDLKVKIFAAQPKQDQVDQVRNKIASLQELRRSLSIGFLSDRAINFLGLLSRATQNLEIIERRARGEEILGKTDEQLLEEAWGFLLQAQDLEAQMVEAQRILDESAALAAPAAAPTPAPVVPPAPTPAPAPAPAPPSREPIPQQPPAEVIVLDSEAQEAVRRAVERALQDFDEGVIVGVGSDGLIAVQLTPESADFVSIIRNDALGRARELFPGVPFRISVSFDRPVILARAVAVIPSRIKEEMRSAVEAVATKFDSGAIVEFSNDSVIDISIAGVSTDQVNQLRNEVAQVLASPRFGQFGVRASIRLGRPLSSRFPTGDVQSLRARLGAIRGSGTRMVGSPRGNAQVAGEAVELEVESLRVARDRSP